jgi:succinyl-CoA synthetase beta subunit
MQLLEFQAKELLTRYDVAVPRGRIADDAGEALRIARRLDFPRYAVKAQIHAGERFAAGGIKFADSPEAVAAATAELIGRPLVTTQTGPTGERVRWVLIEEAREPLRRLYAAVVLDPEAASLALLTSPLGGTDIGARIAADPKALVRTPLGFGAEGPIADFDGLAKGLGLTGEAQAAAAQALKGIARLALDLDAPLTEINPLALFADGRLVAQDAKISIDDNALFRHPALAALRAATQVEEGDPEELAADRHHLNYQRLDGNIGVVVNGAGLALATHDMLVEAGGKPANFMDVRTTATSLDVAYSLEIILANPRVKAVLVNVHGGGMQNCDTIAEGLGIALRRTGRKLPLVVRLAGNNARFGQTRLRSMGVETIDGETMAEAVARVVQAA